MPVSADTLRLHIAYTSWASRRLVEAVAQLTDQELTRDFGTADKSVLGTLVHTYAADRLWLARLRSERPSVFVTEADHSLPVLQNDWPALHDRWKTWAAGITDESVAPPHTYHDLRGREWRQPVWMLVMHVVNHATHHRGQVAGFLRSMGRTPPPLDLIFYYRELEKAASAHQD